jgi:hypothetical protein
MTSLIPRCLIAILALAVFAPTTAAQKVVPLTGEGENIEPVVRVELEAVNEVELAGDWAFVSTDDPDEDGPKLGGLEIVNIADPKKPFVQGHWDGVMGGLTDASFGDVDLSPDANLAVLTNAHCAECTEGEVPWVVLIDTTDKANPKLIGQIIDDETMDYVHTATLDNKMLYTNPQVAAFFPQPGNAHITAFDISDPANPVKVGTISGPSSEAGLAHDSYIDHRPDGKTLMYGASVHQTDVFDITDPLAPVWLQSTSSPQYTISHDVQPNHDRSIIIIDDEGAAGGQIDESVSACGKVGEGPTSVNSGSVHFFEAAPDGTMADNGAAHLGSFNAPANAATGACVAHVFWQAPDENRMTQAYYRTGAFVLEFEDPADPEMLGWFLPEGGAIYWSNKPHRGYMYATDMEHGLDILKYTGEGAARWPATAGPAEVQRSARQGVPYVPIAGVEDPPPPVDPGEEALPCLSGRARIGRGRIGRIRLGMTRERLLRLRVRTPTQTPRSFRYCVKGVPGYTAAVFSSRSENARAKLVLTTARGNGNRRARVGSRATRFRRMYPDRVRVARGLYRGGPRSRRIFGLSRGRVQFIALATRAVAGDRKALPRYVRLSGQRQGRRR